MNLNDYENKYFATYAAFAETVRFILNSALLAAENLPRPQSVQCRAKGAESLRRRLEEVGRFSAANNALFKIKRTVSANAA